ncbi:S46 family peptidase [Luteibaculum oceani]|nr:S46 family peptidase [Luteibaculum oceani]
MKKSLILFGFLFSISLRIIAHEGMWIPSLLKALNESEMKTLGLKLSAEDIYSINQSSLKDAIVHFGGFCTGEIISDQGLVLTNHHCGYGAIQSHSSVENDYLEHGFWAKNKGQELSNPDLFVTFIVSIEDVTEKVLQGTDTLKNPEPVIRRNIAEINKAVKGENGMDGFVRAFYYGNQYFLIKTKTYNDVRLVGAPPSSIGKYGGDTDNWVWPRHTGDFSLFRIYANKNNEPAAYSEDNVPFKPKKHLPISLKGSDDGEFAMVYGFPGRTEHFLSSEEVKHIVETINPARISMRDASLEVINEARESDAKIKIQYAAKQSSISNAWKKWRGQNRGLIMFNAIDKKLGFEADYRERAKQKGKTEYAAALDQLIENQKNRGDITLARANFIELVYVGAEIFKYAYGFNQIMDLYASKAADTTLFNAKQKKVNGIDAFFKDYNAQVDMDILKAQLPVYFKYMDEAYLSETLLEVKRNGNINEWVDKMYAKTLFTQPDELRKILNAGGAVGLKKLSKDPVYLAMKELYGTYFSKIAPSYQVANAAHEELMKTYVQGILELFPEIDHWPDANSTLRLSYGKVEGSQPKDGVIYDPQTTMDGLIAKYIPGDKEFDLPEKMLSLAKDKDYGQYANENGELVVCFTSSNHTSGGNSGSPVINGKGELIGLNFDRSWESTMSDIMFDPSICRNIAVDIRYVLFVVDKYANANHLIEEMDLISSKNN